MKKQLIGLDISDSSLEAIQLEKTKLVAYNRLKLAKGIVEDGRIKNQEKLTAALKKLLAVTDQTKFTSKNIALSLPESRLFIHLFQVAGNLKGDKLSQAVEEQASQTIPESMNKLYWDFEVVEKTQQGQEVLFVGAPVDLVDKYVSVVDKAGFRLEILDFESASMARSLIGQSSNKGPVLLVDIGARTTIISVYDKGSIRSSVNIDVAGNNFTQAIAKKLKISKTQAGSKKRTSGLDEKKEGGEIRIVLESALQPIIKEINNSIEYYQEKTGRQVARLILAGGSSQLPGLSGYLSSNLDLEVETRKTILKLETKKVPAVMLATAIGLALRAEQKGGLNLLPEEPAQRVEAVEAEKEELEEEVTKVRKINKRLIVLLVLLAISIGLLAAAYLYQKNLPVKSARDIPEIKESTTDVAALEDQQQVVEEEQSEPASNETVQPAVGDKTMVTILETGIGYLNVREGAGTNFTKIAEIKPGEQYEFIEANTDETWYEIRLAPGSTGWIFAQYAKK